MYLEASEKEPIDGNVILVLFFQVSIKGAIATQKPCQG